MLYGDKAYGLGLYGYGEDAKQEPEEQEYPKDISIYTPRFINDMQEFGVLFDAAGREIGLAEHYTDSLTDQDVVSAATWGIVRWEAVYGVTASDGMTIEQRRAAVLARIMGAKTCTPALLAEIAQNMTGESVMIEEEPENYLFRICFVGSYGVPRSIRALRRQIELMKPAHMAYEIEYRYVIWSEVANKTWADLNEYTWDGIRVWKKMPQVTWHGLYNAGLTWRSAKKNSWTTVKDREDAKE